MTFTKHDYHLSSCQERLQLLLEVLQYDSYVGKKHFSFYERLLINKQRSSLFTFINYLNKIVTHNEITMVVLPNNLEEKIEKLQQEIKSLNWQHDPKDEY